ncbi:MAG: helix-turn-helix transcriptional regulator [Gaiellaceae bacterium]
MSKRDTNYELVNQRLRLTRKQRGLSLRDVAEEIGVSPSTLSRVERGAAPDLATLNKLIDWLGIDRSAVFHSRPAAPKTVPRQVEVLLRADKNIDPKTATTLAKIFETAYKEMTTGNS